MSVAGRAVKGVLVRIENLARAHANEMMSSENKMSHFIERIGRNEWYYRQLRAAYRKGRRIGIEEARKEKQ